MEIWQQSLTGLNDFIIYFAASLVLLLVFKWAYTLVTPHDEWRLVKEQRSVAAAIGLTGAVIGFCIALAGAVSNSASLVDFIIWGLIALITQLLAFAVLRFTFMPKIAERISNDEISAGVMLGGVSAGSGTPDRRPGRAR